MTDSNPESPPTPAESALPRVVLLGASNVTRGVSCVIGSARLRLGLVKGDGLDAMVACGHGRSYVIDSTVMFRTLPAIQSCRLWDELAERPAAPTCGLITDIGNDVMYGVPVPEIIAAVDLCLRRLREYDARIAITAPPMASIRSLKPRRYRFMRRILFPSCKLTFEKAMERAEQLDDGVRSVASQHGAAIVEPERGWYGVDPIHIKSKHWPRAWRDILAPWDETASPPLAKSSFRRWLALKTYTPRHWKVFNHELARQQPAGTTIDGTTVSMY